jgi:hypothetical protein
MNPPEPGLRLVNRSKQTAKVTVHVAPGDELVVSGDVADQLVAGDSNAFRIPTEDTETPPVDDDHEGTGEPVEMIGDDLRAQLEADARALGIKRVGNKSDDTLRRDIDQALAED